MLGFFNKILLKNLKALSKTIVMARTRSVCIPHSQKLKLNKHTDKALTNFDKFYGALFDDKWFAIRKGLLGGQKYVALVNNYADDELTVEMLRNRGAVDLRLLLIEKKRIFDTDADTIKSISNRGDEKIEKFVETVKDEDISQIYSNEAFKPNIVETESAKIAKSEVEKSTNSSIEHSIERPSLLKGLTEAEMDLSRIIDPEMGLQASALMTFIPATRIKGREDWLPESAHYSYYGSAKDFNVVIENETRALHIPEHLKVYAYEKGGKEKFTQPKRGVTGVYNYYVMDGASILPVLALDLQAGDRMLDMCAAPGGKTLVALQTLLPDIIIANDSSLSRVHRIQRIMKEYLYDFEESNKWQERLMITCADGRHIKDESGFDKVLVDVPCTTDRHSVTENDNNIFRPDRVKERLRLPEIQSDLLRSALSLCRVGGTVVYSTCTLSPIQNDGVVHMGLKKAWETSSIKAKVMRLDHVIQPVKSLYYFGEGKTGAKYGQLVIPHTLSNFGPSYFAKLIRTQ